MARNEDDFRIRPGKVRDRGDGQETARRIGAARGHQLASGRFAMIDDGIGFQLVPWQPVLDKRIGQHITGTVRDAGGTNGISAGNGGWGYECPQGAMNIPNTVTRLFQHGLGKC
jgi:Protein of unknown function (DUF3363)